jgi:heat shock protein HtpX
MSTNLYTHQDGNVAKTWLLMSVFFVMIMAIGWFASWYVGDSSILYIAVAVSIAMNIASYWWSDKIVLSLTGAKPASKETHYELYTIVENLAITAGLPMPKVYVITDPSPNAFATGRNKEHAVVAFTTGLLATLNKTELEGVVAHELAHVGNKDILLQTVVVVLVGFVTLLSDFLLRISMTGGDGDRKGGQLQLIIMIAGFVLALLAPVVAMLMQLAISRKREFLADATGALLTRYPEGLASALEKISMHSGQMQKANHATAHLFIADPFGETQKAKRKSFLHTIFLTHPPVEARTAALRGLKY